MAEDQIPAVVTIKRASKMSPEGRKEVADWLRAEADFLESDGHRFSTRYRGQYRYTPEVTDA